MKRRILAFCAAAALLLTACADGAAAAQTLQNRKKQVVLYTTQINYNEDGTEAYRFIINHRYDEKGNLLGMDNYDGQGSRWEYLYNGDDVKVSQTYYDPDGQVDSTRTFDLNGNPVKNQRTTTIFLADGTTETAEVITEYSYDELGRKVEVVTTENGQESLHETYTYDDATHTGTCRTVSTTLWGSLKGDVSQWTDELTFNEDWQLLTSHYVGEAGSTGQDEVYTYDEAGNETHRPPVYRLGGRAATTRRATCSRCLSSNGVVYEQTSTLGTLARPSSGRKTRSRRPDRPPQPGPRGGSGPLFFFNGIAASPGTPQKGR